MAGAAKVHPLNAGPHPEETAAQPPWVATGIAAATGTIGADTPEHEPQAGEEKAVEEIRAPHDITSIRQKKKIIEKNFLLWTKKKKR
uniref:Uncharacterized protein n=1 Tax=Marseillevirus sp. TaxID=2809551 RepID=A0AA96IYT0_9VIRU|nr:hypothetical protein MarFTMF_328 [Marseillevirus sp.]